MITGASSAVGLATAARVALRGDLVLMGGDDACERVAERLRARGAAAFAAPLDLADPCSIDRFLATTRYLVGQIDALVTDVGLAHPDSLLGAQHLAAQVVPSMVDNERGAVVLISPELLGAAPPLRAVHRELDAWVSALDAEFIGTGVRVSLVRSAPERGVAAPGDVGRLVAALTDPAESRQLRVVEVIPATGSPRAPLPRRRAPHGGVDPGRRADF